MACILDRQYLICLPTGAFFFLLGVFSACQLWTSTHKQVLDLPSTLCRTLRRAFQHQPKPIGPN